MKIEKACSQRQNSILVSEVRISASVNTFFSKPGCLAKRREIYVRVYLILGRIRRKALCAKRAGRNFLFGYSDSQIDFPFHNSL